MNVGFVGLGNLGLAIAENLVSSLPRLLVYNRTASKALPLVEKGATLTMPAGEQTRAILEQSIAAGLGKLDVTAVARAIQQDVGSDR